MTKRTITTKLDLDWQEKFQDQTKEFVLNWINTNVPDGYTLGYDYGYDSATYGYLVHERPETDEEEANREAVDAVVQAARKRKQEDETLKAAEKILKERNGTN